MANLSLRCLLGVFSLSCEREMIRLDRNLRKRNKKKEDDGTESFLPSHPATKAQWTKGCGRGILSLSRNNFGGSGKGRPFVLHFAKRTFSLCSLCSWHKKEVNLHYPFQKKTLIVQTRLNDTAWRID